MKVIEFKINRKWNLIKGHNANPHDSFFLLLIFYLKTECSREDSGIVYKDFTKIEILCDSKFRFFEKSHNTLEWRPFPKCVYQDLSELLSLIQQIIVKLCVKFLCFLMVFILFIWKRLLRLWINFCETLMASTYYYRVANTKLPAIAKVEIES